MSSPHEAHLYTLTSSSRSHKYVIVQLHRYVIVQSHVCHCPVTGTSLPSRTGMSFSSQSGVSLSSQSQMCPGPVCHPFAPPRRCRCRDPAVTLLYCLAEGRSSAMLLPTSEKRCTTTCRLEAITCSGWTRWDDRSVDCTEVLHCLQNVSYF